MTKIDKSKLNFGIIRTHNTPDSATLKDGTIVHKQDTLYIPEWGQFITCAPYDNHFIYEVPKHFKDHPSYMCTCGSPAVIAGLSGYVLDASPQGKLFLCLYHANHGHHARERRWI
jgi:hypothetical protein